MPRLILIINTVQLALRLTSWLATTAATTTTTWSIVTHITYTIYISIKLL